MIDKIDKKAIIEKVMEKLKDSKNVNHRKDHAITGSHVKEAISLAISETEKHFLSKEHALRKEICKKIENFVLVKDKKRKVYGYYVIGEQELQQFKKEVLGGEK